MRALTLDKEPAKRPATEQSSIFTSCSPGSTSASPTFGMPSGGTLPVPADAGAISTPSIGTPLLSSSAATEASATAPVPVFGASASDTGIAPVPVFGTFGGSSSDELVLGAGSSSASDVPQLNPDAPVFEPPSFSTGAVTSSSSSFNTSSAGTSGDAGSGDAGSGDAGSGESAPTKGILAAGDDNPFLQNMQGSDSILSGASFTFSGGPSSIDAFGSTEQTPIAWAAMNSGATNFGSEPMTFGAESFQDLEPAMPANAAAVADDGAEADSKRTMEQMTIVPRLNNDGQYHTYHIYYEYGRYTYIMTRLQYTAYSRHRNRHSDPVFRFFLPYDTLELLLHKPDIIVRVHLLFHLCQRGPN